MDKIDYLKIVKDLRKNKVNEKKKALIQAKESDDILEKCVLLRMYTTPQSTDAEKLLMNDLEISPPLNKVSGDGVKNGINYEIKVSVHDAKCKTNIRQIRPHHDVDYYIIMALNIFSGEHGEAYIFKVPSQKVYDLIPEYGGYTHGTIARNGTITVESIKEKSKDFEYSLTADPNGQNNSKSRKVWDELMKYKVPYSKESF